MASFEQHIEGLTQIAIGASSAPTTDELTQMLVEGLIHTVNTITTLKPEELSKFTKTTNATGAINKRGKVLSVEREHNSTSVLRPCTPIHPSLRYEATDVDSLHYRSKYNPAYYELNNSIYCVPTPNDASNNDLVVNQIYYDTGLTAADDYNATAIENFPLEYEYLLGLYGASRACQAAANDIQNNMPTKPTAPDDILLLQKEANIPDLPEFNTALFEGNYSAYKTAIRTEDLDVADKEFKIVEKQFEEYDKKIDLFQKMYDNSFREFEKKLDAYIKDSDRFSQVQVAEYKNKLEKYAADTAEYSAELQEEMAQYKWYMESAMNFMSQYMASISAGAPTGKPQAQPQERNK